MANNVTQGVFDTVVSERPATDTVREANLNLLQESIKKSPPEVVPILLEAAFEISDLPNKEKLLERIRPIMGLDPIAEDMSEEERKRKVLAEIEAQQQKQAEMDQVKMLDLQAEIKRKELENAKLAGEVDEVKARTLKLLSDAKKSSEETELKGFETGMKLGAMQR